MEAPRTSRTTGMRSEFDGLFARCRIWRSVDPLARRSELAASLAKARRKAAFLATIGPQEDCWQQLPFGVRARCGWRSWGDFLRPSGDRVQRYTSIFRTTFSSPGKSTLSSCRPSLLHDRWRDWCPAGVLSSGARPAPDDESAVPAELVPGAAALLPKAPPVTDMCDPMPPPRANAVAVERPTKTAMQRMERVFMLKSPLNMRSDVTADRRYACVRCRFAIRRHH